MRFDSVQTIKDRLAMREVVEHYGYKIDRKGFLCCPFHKEKTPSMKIYEKSYHCFGCGANGDVISFVQQLFGLSFPDSLKKIDIDFSLGLYCDHTFEELRRSHYRNKQVRAEKERKEREREQAEKYYWSVFDEWKRLDDNKRDYAPKATDEEWNPLFVEALQKLAYQEYLLNCAEIRRWECDRGNHTNHASKRPFA